MSSPIPRHAAVSSAPPCVAPAEPERWFKEEVQPHGPLLKSYLRGTFPTVRDIDDVVQESYLRIWQRQAAKPIASAKAFLFQIARRLALDVIREKSRRKTDTLGDLAELGVIDDRPNALETLSYNEKVALFAAALARLPDRCRTIFILRKFQNLPQREVAAQLHVSERTVESQVARAMTLLENDLRAHGVDGFCRNEKP